jgi:hypothetical protein
MAGEPEVMAPRFEMMLLEDAPHGFSGDRLHDSISDQLVCNRSTIPLGERTPMLVWPFTS